MIQILAHRERETIGEMPAGPALGFREGTTLKRYPVAYVFNDGGMGDYVNYAAATRWIAKNCPWIDGYLFLPNYLVPLMRDIHREFKHWQVWPAERIEQHLIEGISLVGPGLNVNGKSINPQLLTVVHAHPVDVGFSYFAGGAPAPEGVEMPILDYARERLLPKVKQIRGPYAVFTTGGTTQTRTLKGRHINPLIEYTKSLGITPVFIGKENHVGDGRNTVKFAGDINFDIGLDLRNATAVKDAAAIMQHAEFTLGLDNGNLHLAALMKDSRVIFGYNITSVAHRVPRRTHGRTINMSVPPEELSCSGCQSKWHQMHTQQFDKCFYGDVKCIDLLFKNDGEAWKRAIDEIIKE